MNPPNPRMHVVNPDEEKKRKSARWETIQTVAITTLVGMAVGGIGYAGWKLASRRFTKLMRRQNAEQEAVAATAAAAVAYPYQQAAGYPGGYPPPQQYAYPAYPAQWSSAQIREQMPDALRDVPTFHAPPVGPPPVMPITQVAPQAVSIGADPFFRKFASDLQTRFSSIDQRLSTLTEQLGDDDEDDDDEDDEPRSRRSRGGN